MSFYHYLTKCLLESRKFEVNKVNSATGEDTLQVELLDDEETYKLTYTNQKFRLKKIDNEIATLYFIDDNAR